MNKNVKRIFFVLAIFTLLVSIGAVCAADEANSTSTVDSSVSDTATVSDTASDTIAAEPATTTSNDNKVDTKTIEKEDKTLKTSTKTIEVNNRTELIEAVNSVVNDTENDEYIINLNNGNYTYDGNIQFSGQASKTIIINGNNQTFGGIRPYYTITFNNGCNFILNDLNITFNMLTYTDVSLNNIVLDGSIELSNSYLKANISNSNISVRSQYANNNITIKNSNIPILSILLYNGNSGVVTIENSTVRDVLNRGSTIIMSGGVINGTITLENNGNFSISNDVEFTANASFTGTGNYIIDDYSRLLPYLEVYNGTYTLDGATILKYKTNYGNLTIKNSIINTSIFNEGNITFDDNCIFGENCNLVGSGSYMINDISKIVPYFQTFNGTYTLNNITITQYRYNYGNLTINNSTIIISSLGLQNYGNLSINNAFFNSTLVNYRGGYTLLNNCYIDSQVNNQANITINNSNINSTKTFNNQGDLVIINSIINQPINNPASRTITIINSTVNSSITNNGNLIIDDNTNYDLNTIITGSGTITTNNTDKIAPYMQTYNGNYILNNVTIISQKTNTGNLTVNNSNINQRIINRGKMEVNNTQINSQLNNMGTLNIYNSTLNATIGNSGTLFIDENSIVTENFKITGNGQILTNNTQIIELLKENNIYLGDNVIENTVINTPLTNYGKLTINNSTVNTTITNNGLLIVNEDNTFTDNTQITGTGEIITTDITTLIPYMSNINGTYTIENMTFNKRINFYGDIILVNCVINNIIPWNYEILTLKNCTINGMIYNYGVIFVDDDTTLNSQPYNLGNSIIIYGDRPDVINPRYFEGDNTVENITFILPSSNTGNLRLINCNITAKITNTGNITFENCNFSNNDLNTTITSNGNLGFLVYNTGSTSLINCIMENNTFNVSRYSFSSDILNGAIYNNGVMTIINSTFHNNSIGFSRVDSNMGGALQGIHFGRGTIVVNNATLSIDGSNFTSNYAGESGGAIYSTVGTYSNTTLNVNNSYFADNKAGLQGGAISFFGTGSIENTVFINNSEVLNHNVIGNTGGGAIYSAGENQIITNCTFIENDAICEINGLMFVGSTGGAIRSTTTNLTIEDSKFINNYATTNGNSLTINSGTVKNSYFQNNQTGPSNEVIIGYANIVNNTFTNINNTDYIINIASNQPGNLNEHITENNFTNNKVNIDTINTIQNNITIENNMYKNTTIDDTLTLEIPDKIFENEAITINGTYTINNPQNYDQNILEQNKFQVYINGVLTYTLDEISFNITPTPGNMLIIVQPTISQTRSRNMLTSTKLAVITPENYDNYIIEGELLGIAENSQVSFVGNFTDKGEIYINTANIILNGENATFTNTTFTLDKPNITLENMKIINTNTTYPIKSYANNNTIQNNNITLYNTIGDTAAIYTKASNTLITNNTINVTGPAGNIDWESDSSGICTTQAILAIESENNTITYNNITVNGTTTGESFGTIEGITNSRKVNNSLIAYNNITVTGGYFNYAINQLDRINNSTVTENNILVTGFRYADGIQIGDNATNINITKNNITCICLNDTPVDEAAITYGIITTCQGGEASNNFTINENNINLTGAVNYGMEIYQTTNTQITNNNITANGNYSMGIGLAHSPNSNINENIIKTYGDSTTNYTVTEEIQPANVGIKVQQNSNQVNITNNTIITNDENQNDKTIDTDSQQTTITNNQLISSNGYGQNTIKTTQPDTSIENNIVTTTTTINVPETIITNTPVTLTATVTTTDGTPINGGLITFTKGNEVLAQATVTDGIATATVTFTQEEDATITATYTPESTGLSTSNDESTTSIQAPVTQLNIEDVELTAGEIVTLTTTVKDQTGNNINGGKVTFKVNGKTVKDANGKVIYAKVVDGIATVDYAVPEDLAGKDVNITAVYSGSNKYNKESTTITKTVAAPEPTLTITPITDDVQTGSTITLKAKVAVSDKAIITGKIVFKINGKTVKDANGKVIYAKVDANGEVSIDYTIPESYKTGNYTIEATFIAPGYDKITANTTMSVVKA